MSTRRCSLYLPSSCFPVVGCLGSARGAVLSAERWLFRLFRLVLEHLVEQLTHEAQSVDLIVIASGRERQQLCGQLLNPRRVGRDVQSIKRHAATDRLGPNCLVATGWERLPSHVGP